MSRTVLLGVFVVALAGGRASAGEERPTLQVGVERTPPYAYQGSDGQWKGLSIDLWEAVAESIGVGFELREMRPAEMIERLERGNLDAAVGDLSPTAEREARIDFSHSYYHSGLGIAARARTGASIWPVLERIFTARLFKIVAGLVVLVLLTSFLFYRFERPNNEKVFSGPPKRGLGEGLWWSIVLLTGKVVHPQTFAARSVAVLAMLASALIISALAGAISSALTVRQLGTTIHAVEDLEGVRTAAVEGRAAPQVLRQRRISHRTYPSLGSALEALAERRMDAVVHDAAMLKHAIDESFSEKLDVLPIRFDPQEYMVALPPDSKWEDPINRALLRIRWSEQWKEIRYRYLGK